MLFRSPKSSAAPTSAPALEADPDDVAGAVEPYMALTEALGAEFPLIDVHRKSREAGLAHPHLSISRLRNAGLLIPVGEDRFTWQTPSH